MDFKLPTKKIKIINLGRNKFSSLSIYPKATKVLSTELGRSGLYKTGLTEEEEKFFEKYFKYSEGTLSKKPADNKDGSNYWADLEIRLDAKRNNELNLEDPKQYIKYKVMLESSKICNSPLEKHKWPDAEWMIMDEESDSKIESVEIDKEVEAIEVFNDLSEEDKKGVLRLYGKRNLEKSSPSLIKSALYKELKKNPTNFIKTATDKSLKMKVLIEDLITANIITRNGNYFKNGDEPIGNSIEEVVSYLEDAKNQTILVALKGKLKSK